MMGLSSSQGRLLMLTSRLSDIELQQILLSQRQNRLAWDQEKIAKTYSEAMNNYKLMIRVPENSYSDAKKVLENLDFQNLSYMGYVLTDSDGNIYLNKKEDGTWDIPNDMYGNPLLTVENDKAILNESLASNYTPPKTEDEENDVFEGQTGTQTDGSLIEDPEVNTNENQASDSEPKVTSYNIVEGKEMISNPKILQQQIMNGRLYMVDLKDLQGGLSKELLQADKQVEWVLDTSDDALAESVYNYETTQLERKENAIEMEIKQLETQHEAIIKEIESVDKLISNNIDRTFKLFSDG